MTAHLPDAVTPTRFTFAADFRYLTPLRDRFIGHLSRSLPEPHLHDWKLVLTELTANAILHGATEDSGKNITVEWWFDGPAVHLAVTDPGDGPPAARIEEPELPVDPLAESGRGLFMVHAVTDRLHGYPTPHGYRVEASRAYPELGRLLAVDAEMEQALDELSSCYESLSIFGRLADNLEKVEHLGRFIEDAIAGFLNLHPNSRVRLVANSAAPSLIIHALAGHDWFVGPPDTGREPSPLLPLGTLTSESIPGERHDCPLPDAYVVPIISASVHFGSLAVTRANHAPASFSKPLGALRTLADLCAIACANHHLNQRRQRAKLQLREFELAVGIQKSILPILPPPQFPHALATLHQASSLSVSGDFAEARLAPDGSLVIAIIDVMGKGVAAALLASMFRTAFDLTLPLHPAAAILHTLNLTLCRQLDSLTMFLTCAVLRISPDGRLLDHASAGHCPTLVFHPDGQLTQLEASGPPLGLFADMTYQSETMPAVPGSRVVMLTDGTYEWDRPAHDSPDGGWQRVIDFLARERETDSPILWNRLLENMRRTAGPNLEDDCTLVTLDFPP